MLLLLDSQYIVVRVYCISFIFNLNAYSSRDRNIISVHLFHNITEDAEIFLFKKKYNLSWCLL